MPPPTMTTSWRSVTASTVAPRRRRGGGRSFDLLDDQRPGVHDPRRIERALQVPQQRVRAPELLGEPTRAEPADPVMVRDRPARRERRPQRAPPRLEVCLFGLR